MAYSLASWDGALPKVEHPAPEVADVLRIHLAEIAEIVLAHKVRRSLLHGLNIKFAMLQDVVLVFPPTRAEPVSGAYQPANLLGSSAVSD